MNSGRAKRKFELEALEARVLLSGDSLSGCVAPPLISELFPASQETVTADAQTTETVPVINYDPATQVNDIFEGVSEPAPTGQTDEGSPANGTEDGAAGAPAAEAADSLLVEPDDEFGTDSGVAAGVTGPQTDVSNPATAELTDTLRGANGPPENGSNGSVHLTPEAVLDLGGGTLELGPQDVLSGNGIIVGGLSGNGTIRPGNSPGHITMGTFTPGLGTVTEIEIEGLGQGTNYDWIEITGAASLNGTLKILFSPSGGYVPALGDTFEVMTWGSVTGDFANWLNTSNIPGHPDWSFKPTITGDSSTPGHLVLQIVQTPTLAVGVDTQINNGLDTLSDVADLLDGFGELAEGIPLIGSQLGNLADSGTAITDVIKNQLSALLSTLPRVSQVTTAIQGWDNTTSGGGLGIAVKGVLGHYGALSTDPMWWEVTLELTPNAVNQPIQDVLGGVFEAAFSGTTSTSVAVNTTLTLDFAFGYDSGFFVEVDGITAAASVNAAGLGGFGFDFDTPLGTQGLSGSGGTVNLQASVTATPDAGVLTNGRITSATLTDIKNGGINVGDAFNLDEAGTLDAAFPLTGTLNFIGFTLTGGYTLRMQDTNLMDAEAPDVTVDVNSTLTVQGQTLSGSFTLKNTGTETIIAASNVTFNLGAGSDRVLSIQNGSGTFVLLGAGGLAGTLTMDLNLGPAVPDVTLSLTGLNLRLNTSNAAVPTIDGVAVNLPAGPYYRVSGNGTIGVPSLEATLSGDFVFEPRDADSNTGNGYEEVAVGVANLSFDFTDTTNTLVSVSDGTGAFVFRSTGIVGTLSVDIALGIPDVNLYGVFGVTLNNTGSAYNQNVNVNGTTVTVNVPAGPYLKVTAKGNTDDADPANDLATLEILGISLNGEFSFESKTTTTGGERVVTLVFSSVSLDLGSVANDLISVTDGEGVFILTNDGVAGTATATVSIGVSGVSLSGTFTVAINTTSAPVNETVNVDGTDEDIILTLPGPYLQVNGSPATLTVLGMSMTGNFSFEQRESADGTQLVTVLADSVNFDFGTNIVSLTNGSAFLLITDGGVAGHGEITAAVNAFGGSFSHTFEWSFNNTTAPIAETVDWEGTPMPLDLPAGPFNTIDSGSTPVSITVPIGSYNQTIMGRFIITLLDPNSPTIALTATTSGGVNGVSHSTAALNPGGDNNAVSITTTALGTAGDYNGTVFRYVDDPTITTATATAEWDDGDKVLTVRVNTGVTPASAVVSAINGAGSPFTASAVTDGVGTPGIGTFKWYVATVGVSSVSATLTAGPVSLAVSDGSGAFVIFESGMAGEVTVGSVSLTNAGPLGVNAMNLELRFNNTGTDVGNPDPVVVAISDDSSEDISIQFAGDYYHEYLAVSGTAEISGLTGAVTLAGNFAFERGQIDINDDANPEDVFKIGATDLHFELKAGSLSVVSFHNGTGAFIITPDGIAGTAALDFEVGIVSISGTLKLEVNTTSSPVVNAVVPLPGGDATIDLPGTNYVLVCVTNGYLHLGSIAVPLPTFEIVISGGTVVIQPKGGLPDPSDDYLSVDSLGNISTGISFSDFAAPSPFEFVSMLRQALIWIDSFRDASVFDVAIPFTGGKTLGDAFDWSQLFFDKIYSHMVTVELQSRNLALETVDGDNNPIIKSGSLTNARFILQLGQETPVEVTVNTDIPTDPFDPTTYSNADNSLDELVADFNYAIGLTALAGRVVARIHKLRDELPTDPDYADRYKNDIFVIALTETEIAKGTLLNLVDLDSDIAELGFGPPDDSYGDANDTTAEQVGIVTNRYDTRQFFEELADLLIDDDVTNDNGGVDYDPAKQVYTYNVNKTLTYDTMALFGTPTIPFDFDAELGPIADASISGALEFLAQVGFNFTLGFDLGAREVPRILNGGFVPIPANGRITADATFRIYLNDELTPLTVTLPASLTSLNNSIDELAADLNSRLAATFYSGPLTNNVSTPLDQLLVAQKAGTGLAFSAIHEIDTDDNGTPDPGKDLNADGNTDDWLGIINRITITSAKNDPFATELGFGNDIVDLDGLSGTTNDQIFVSIANSSIKGLFIDNVSLTGSVDIHESPLASINGSLRFGFVEINTTGGSFGTVNYDGTDSAPLTATLSLEDQTTGQTRFYLADLFNGTSSDNIANFVNAPTFTGSVLARLDNITVGGLGFNFPLGADPEVSVWVPDINDLDYNPDPYDGTNTGIFLKYPQLGALEDFGSLNFTKIIRALNLIADQLSQLSAFSFLDQRLPFVNMSVNDMLDYAQRFADLLDAAAAGGSQSSLQKTISELEDQIEQLFNLDPDVLTLSIDDGGVSGLSGTTTGGNNVSTQSSFTFTLPGDNNDITIRTSVLATSANFNGSVIRFVADPSITNTSASASWDAANKVLTIRVNSGHTTAAAVEAAVDALANWDADLATPDNNTAGNTGAGAITTSAFVATGGIDGVTLPSVTLMPGGDNNNFSLTLKAANIATAADYNGSVVRLVGDSTVTGNSAQVSWNAESKTLTIKINPGVTTANAIISAITNAAGIPWNAALAPPDNAAQTNTGTGPITTTALKFSLAYATAYADSLPFQLDLNDLVNQLVGDSNAAIRALLDVATTLVQIRGEGRLTVSASAAVTLEFGLDLTNPSSIKPFLYDTTGVVLKAKVLGTDLEIEASLGGVFGIFIHDGKLTLDADGNPDTNAGSGDQGATFRLGLLNNNGDNRHYFDEDFFDFENIDLTMQGGVSAQLPIFAPFDGNPLSGDDDANGDGYPDNYLVIDVPDLVRLFQDQEVSTRANENSNLWKTVVFAGAHNDLIIKSTSYSNYNIVFLNNTSGGGANASFNTGTNTLTVNIDAGDTSAAAALAAIQGATNSGGAFATSTLTLDDDGGQPGNSNTGAGKLNKLVVTTPDFGSLFDDLDLCAVFASQIGTILDGLDALLGSIEDGLRDIVSSIDLPLVGDGMAGAANFIEEFRSGLLQNLRDEVTAAGGNGLTAIENAVKKALWNSIGPGGLDLLVDFETGQALDLEEGYSQLAVTLDCDEGLIVNVRLKKDVALLDTTQDPIDFKIGVPGFGLEVDGNVVLSVGFDLKFGFGFNSEDGFFFNTSAPASDPELVLEFKAEIPGLHAAGQLLFLQLDVTDDAEDPSLFRGFFEVDLMDPDSDGKLTFAEITSSGTQFGDILHAVLGAEAHINLDLIASFGGNTAFPRVLASFHLDWMFDTDSGAGDPEIAITDIYLDLGTFISDFLGPVLAKIQEVTGPVQPIIDVVTARIPVLSDLAGEDITLLTLAEVFGLLEPTTVDFIEDVIGVVELINSLEGLGEGTVLIPLGGFSLLENENGERKGIAALQNVAAKTMDEVANAIEHADDPGTSSTYKSAAAGFVSDAGSLNNFSIPIWDNPSELFNLFIGEPVRLVEWRMPTFKFQFTYTQKIPIYPPLYAQFGGSIGATIDIGFGYDTYGIQKFIASEDKNVLDIFDGFYVIDFDSGGNERPELTLTGEVFAGASISLLIVEAGVNGGIGLTVEFDLNDVNDDGKVRVSEIVANVQQSPLCIFDIHGEVFLFLEAFLKIDLFFFSIDKTWRFAEITLVEFDITCPEPILASDSGGNPYTGGDLYLNIGSRASFREEIDTSDNAERFIVKHTGGGPGSEVIEVQWGNFKQQFTLTGKLIVEDAGQGDDYIDLRGIVSESEVHGGAGNDTIFLSDAANSEAWGDGGNDTITASTDAAATGVVLHGGDGNDTLVPGAAAITIYGDAGNDTITGSDEPDTLYGDDGTGTSADGDDNIVGNDGDDTIRGGKGNDTLEGSAGNDWIRGDDGADVLRGSRGDDVLDGGGGDDSLYGSSGNDLLLGGAGSDWANGHGGIDLLIGENESDLSINNDTISSGTLANIRAAIAAIPTAGITVKNISGKTSTNTGHDLLIGGGNVDALFGGPGNDFLYGGNFMNTGETEVIEEDDNDFFDGGPGEDTIFGDDAMGKTGERNTGIAIKSSIWFDKNGNNLRDSDEVGFAGVTVRLYRQSDPANVIATEETDVDGIFEFNGLDKGTYFLRFELPTNLSFVPPNAGGATSADEADDDSDMVDFDVDLDIDGADRTNPFEVDYDETESAVSAGYTGPAQVSITDQSVTEGQGGQTSVTFTVTLSHFQPWPVEIEYRTANGQAEWQAGDYEPVGDSVGQPNPVLTFAPGQLSQTITLAVYGETTYEAHEQFQLQIVRAQQMDPGGAVNLSVPHPNALVTIENDDPIPAISIQDFQQMGVDHDNDPLTAPIYDEGMPATFLVTLSNPSAYPISVQWRTDPALTFQALEPENAATPSGFPGADFVMDSNILTFPPGVTNRQITVTINNESLDEPLEEFFVDIYNPTYATIEDGRAFGIIADDDDPVSVTIVPDLPVPGQPFTTQVPEGTNGLTTVSFWVKLSGASGKTITVTWATSPGTAVEAVYSGGTELEDYIGAPNDDTPDDVATLVFYPSSNPADWMKRVDVTIKGDPNFEGLVDPETVPPNLRVETFFVNILSADNADIAATPASESNHVTVKIVDDDAVVTTDAGPWSVYFDSPTYAVDEPDGAAKTIDIIIRRTPGSSEPIAVFYTTNGTASAGSDYEAVFRRLVYFAGDDLEETVSITILPDVVPTVEGDETVHLWLRNPTGGPVRASPDHAVLTIRDSDTPSIHVTAFPTAATEGSGGGTDQRAFLVYLLDADGNIIDAPPGGIAFNWRTVDMTARSSPAASKDFTAVNAGSDTIPAGDWFTWIYVDVVKDDLPELSETFAVRVTSAPGAILKPENNTVIATIYDDDKTPIRVKVFYDNNGNGFKDLSEKTIQDVAVEFTYYENGSLAPAVPGTYVYDVVLQDYFYEADVLLGQVGVLVDGATVTSPYKNLSLIIPFLGSGNYETTTENETQSIQFEGIVGLPAFEDVGYDSTFTFSSPTGADDVGRGGTDDVIFGGPGNDIIDAGAGDDHVIGGHWMTATDEFAPVNLTDYNAVVTATTDPDNPEEPANDPPLHNVYDKGPIFGINTTSPDAGINANGTISGQIWIDENGNGQQDPTDDLLLDLVFVNLYDCSGNPINTVVTTNGLYTFTGLYLKDDGSNSDYVVEFVLPHDYTFIAYVPGPDAFDSNAIVGGRTSMISLNNTNPGVSDHAADQDAGIKDSDVARLSITGGFRFGEASYSVSENVKDGVVTISVKRTNAYTQRVVVVRTEDDTASAGVNFGYTSAVLFFDIGETEKILNIPIYDTDSLAICTTPLTFELVLRDATGRPYDRARVYIGGDSWGGNPDDDIIDGNLDWDLILGDSGNIPADAVIQDIVAVPPINNITTAGGPGKDIIRGGDGNDWINGQLFNDIIFGGVSDDEILAGLGDDIVYAEMDNDNIDGDYGDDTIISLRDVPWIELETNPPLGNTSYLRHKMSESAFPLSTFTLKNFEVAQIFGGPRSATYKFISWDGAAYVSGAQGNDTLLVENNSDMLLRDATLFEGLFNLLVHGFFKDASLTLPVGSTYHLGSLENVQLTGGIGDNTLDASGYSRRVTFVGLGGDDVLIGGSAADTFLFDGDMVLGTDTVTGNGGSDTLSFAGTSNLQPIILDMDLHVSQPVAGANLSLVLTDDIENATGGDGDDVLKGNGKPNVLLGGKGDDTLQGRGGNETYSFDTDDPWGVETIIEDAGGGNDTLNFSGTTTLSVNINISITGFQVVNGNLSLIVQDSGGGEAEIENIIGGALSDTIRGNHYDNNLFGGPGADLLDGKSGNDTLDGGTGNDDLNGGADTDSITVAQDTNFTLTDASLARGTGELDLLDNIEVANLKGGPGVNVFNLTGWTGSGSIDGADVSDDPRNDTLIVAANADFTLTDTSLSISTSLGTLTLTTYIFDLDPMSPPPPQIRPTIEIVILTDGPGDHKLDASGYTGSAVLNGGEGDDELIGGSGPDALNGGPGNDILTGNGDNDVMNGGTGSDTLSETHDAYQFIITDSNLLTDLTNAVGDEEFDSLTSLEIAILTGGPSPNIFDVTGWTANTMTVNGAGDTDLVTVQVPLPALPAPAGGTVTLTTTSVTFTGSSAVITLSSIEQAIITGTDRDEILDASAFAGPTLLRGMGGDDVLMSGQGGFIQLMDGGEGSDRFVFVENGTLENTYLIGGTDLNGGDEDTLDFSAFASGVTVDLSAVGVLQPVLAGELSLYLVFEDIENIIGGAGADVLTGNALNNSLTGGPGTDSLDGLGGSNVVVETSDAFLITLTPGTLQIDLTPAAGDETTDTLLNIQRAILTGGASANTIDASTFTGSATLIGEGGDDVLRGGSGGDILIGGAGNDVMRGNAGGDTYLFDADNLLGEDTVDEAAGGGNDFLDFRETTTVGLIVDLSLTSQQTVHATNLKLTITDSTGLEYLAGGDQADTLRGNTNTNFFVGGRGNDIISGAGGADTVFEFVDADFTLVSTAPTTAQVTIVSATGTEQDQWVDIESANFTAGEGNNTLDASQFTAGPVTLIGGAGDDILVGGYGNDTLRGGEGDDNLVGGAGADTLRGDAGEDTLNGSGAFDTTLGSDGNDNLIGGTGSDTYVFDLSEVLGVAVPQGSDTITEAFGGGAHDTIVGIGLAGIDIDLSLGAAQDYYDSLMNLVLSLTLSVNQIEHSFP